MRPRTDADKALRNLPGYPTLTREEKQRLREAVGILTLIADRTNIDPPAVRQLRGRFTEEQLRQLTELLESGWQGTWEQLAAVVTA